MQQRNSRFGFSLIEMMVATVLVLVISAVSYRVLRDQGASQNRSVWGQKQNSMAIAAMDRFKKDLSLVDSTWFEHGIPSVYPQQGFGLGENFYVNTYIQSEGLNDSITFITRNVERSGLYALLNDASFPAATGGAVSLYDDWLEFDAAANFELNDFVMFYKPGQYAIGVVSDIANSTPLRIKIRQLNAAELQDVFLNTWGRSSGYVTKPGLVQASFDWNGTYTAQGDDDSAMFERNQTVVQVIKPITYALDWATDDGQPHFNGSGNAYLMDENGNRKKVLVRTEYTNQGIKREYISEANMLGITYDVLVSKEGGSSPSLSGYTESDIIKNVGRETGSPIHFVSLGSDPDQSSGFVPTARIVSVRMMLGSDIKSGPEVDQKFNEIQVSLNSDIENKYQESGKAVAVSSGNITQRAGLTGTRQIGQPLYIRYPGSDSINVVVPVVKMNDSDSGFENGKLVVMNDMGCPINDSGCASSSTSQITFNSPTSGQFAGSYFYPSNMIQAEGKIMVGGFAVKVDNSTNPPGVTRVPAMASIDIGPGQTMADVLATPPGPGSLCSVGNCDLRYYNTSSPLDLTSGSPNRFKDTAGGFAIHGDDMYVASLTKTSGVTADSTLSLYKTSVSNPTQFTEVVVGGGIAAGKVITAISQSTFKVDDNDYVGICVSRNISQSVTPGEDGAIYMFNVTDPSVAPIKVADHNFKCTSIQEMNGGALIGGKLVNQTLQQGEIASIIRGQASPSMIYTDEVANFIQATGTKHYADGFYTTAGGFTNPAGNDYASVFGWNTGASVQKISPMEYGLVLGNRSQIHDSHTGDDYSQQDFTTVKVNYGGMQERVLASIETDFTNLNESRVSAVYGETQAVIPNGSILAGVLYAQDHARIDVAPLPEIVPSMSEASWFDFYMDYVDLQNRAAPSPLTALPDPASAQLQCGSSIPPTCGI